MNSLKKTTPLLILCLALPLAGHAEGLLAIDNPARTGTGNKVYTFLEAFEGNDQVAMSQYGGDWAGHYTPRNGINLGVLFARAEMGVQWQGYRFGILSRAEAIVEANRDTSDLVQQYSTSSGYTVGRSYQIDYQINGFEAHGARLSKSRAFTLNNQWQMDAGLGLSYLQGQRVKLQTASGQVVTLNTQDFNANAQLNNSDSRINTTDLSSFNAPFGRQATPSGRGYALDVGMVLRHSSGTHVELAVADLAGRIDWTHLPNNVSDYSTATKYYDANGYVQFNPTATRISSYRDVLQTLDPKLWLAASYPTGSMTLQLASSYTRGYWFPQAGVTYHVNPQWAVKADFDFRFSTLALSLQHPWFYVGLRMDGTDLASAKAYGLNSGLNIPF